MKEWEKSLNMVGDENHFQKGSQLQEEIASGISKGRKANEKLFSPYFRFRVGSYFLSTGTFLRRKKTNQCEHSVIVQKHVISCPEKSVRIFSMKINLCN